MNTSEKIDSLKLKINKLNEKINDLNINEEKLRLKCNGLEDTVNNCCSKKNLEERIIAHSDLKNLIREFKKFNENGEKRDVLLNKRLEAYEKKLVVHERYFLIGVGVILTLESFGVGDILRKQILGG